MIIYKEIPGYPKYRAGTDGTIWRWYPGRKREPGTGRWKPIKAVWQSTDKKSVIVNLSRKTKIVGRIILETFVGPCPSGKECCHFPDRDPMNCRLENLRWGTSKENNYDQVLHGTRVRGETHPQAKFTDKQIRDIRALKGKLKGYEIAAKFHASGGYISEILRGNRR